MRYVLNVDPRIKMPDDIMKKFWNLPVYVPFQGPVTDDSAKKFIENFEGAENAAHAAGQKVLPVTINTGGGSPYAALGMIDTMRNCSLTVATIVESKAMSAGAWLFTCGADGHRYISPGGTIMVHPCHGGVKGKIDDMKISTQEGERLNKLMLSSMSTNCGHPEGYFEEYLKTQDQPNTDWFLDAKAALKYNLATKIGAPTMNINVSLDFGLST